MIVSLIGSHGTGKTTVFEALKKEFKDSVFFPEAIRFQVPSFGYNSPIEIIQKVGISALEILCLNSWSVIDKKANPLLDNNTLIFTDRSSLDNLAYYTAWEKSADDKSKKLIHGMAEYYASIVDLFIYFPCNVFPLEGDDMRLDSEGYQFEIDINIKNSIEAFQIPLSKIYNLKTVTIENRISEIKTIINEFQ